MHKTLKTIWVSTGILIFLWTAFWYFKYLEEPGITGNVLNCTFGLYLLFLYVTVAIVYWINKWLYKSKDPNKKKKKRKYSLLLRLSRR